MHVPLEAVIVWIIETIEELLYKKIYRTIYLAALKSSDSYESWLYTIIKSSSSYTAWL